MPYCTQLDVQRAAGGREKLEQLTDQSDAGTIDATAVTAAVEEAQSMIDGYLQIRYAVPVPDVDVPAVLRQLCARMTVYILRYDREALTEAEQTRQDGRMEWLEGVRKGEITLGLDPRLPESTSVSPQLGDRESTRTTSLTRKKFGDSGFA